MFKKALVAALVWAGLGACLSFGQSYTIPNTASSPTWTGVHTFNQSPLVPTPTVPAAATPKSYVDSKVGGIGPNPPAFTVQGANSGVTGLISDSNVTINTSSHQGVNKLPTANVLHADFGVGQTITTITLSPTNPSCTGTPAANIPAPGAATGVQAIAQLGCIGGIVYVDIMKNQGAGYSGTVTGTVTGGGTSGVTFTAVLRPNPGPADISGIACSDNAIQSAISWSAAHPGTTTGPYPTVYLPGTFTDYLLCAPLEKPAPIMLVGDAFASTNVKTSGNFPWIISFRPNSVQYFPANGQVASDGGGIKHINYIGNDSASTTDAIQLVFNIGDFFEGLGCVNTGGMCIDSEPHNERNHFENNMFGNARACGLVFGNEDYLENDGCGNPGITASNYAFGINSVNGAYTAGNYSPASVTAAVGDGSGGAYFAANISTSPVVVGAWFSITGIPDITQLNGQWQVVKVLNGCQAATSPYNSSSVCLTSNSNSFVVITTLNTGMKVPDGDWAGTIIRNPTLITPSGSATVTGVQFKAHLFTQYNPSWILSGTGIRFLRSSTKSMEFNQGVTVLGYQVRLEDFYVEAGVMNGGGPAAAAGSQEPYFVGTGTLSCPATINAAFPCTGSVVSAFNARYRSYFSYYSMLNLIALDMDIVCYDFDPAQSGVTCAGTPGVNKNQFEKVKVVFNEAPPYNSWIVARNESGSTAPANTNWGGNGEKYLYANLPGQSSVFSINAFDMDLSDNHLNSIFPVQGGFNTEANQNGDTSGFPDAEIAVGDIPNYVTNYPNGYTGQASLTPGAATIHHSMEPGTLCSTNEALGNECVKGFSRASINYYGNINTTQNDETAANIASCQLMNSILYPTILVNYANNATEGYVTASDSQVHMARNSTTAGTACLYKGTIAGQAATTLHDDYYGEYDFKDFAGNSVKWIWGLASGNLETEFLSTPTGGAATIWMDISPSKFNLGCATGVVSASNTTCNVPAWGTRPQFWSGSGVIFPNWSVGGTFNNGGSTVPTTFTVLDTVASFTGLTTSRDLTQWNQISVSALKASQFTLNAASPSTVSNVFSISFTPTAQAAASCGDQTVTIANMVSTDIVVSVKPPSALGNVSAQVTSTASGTANIHFCNPSAASVTPPSGTWTFTVIH